MKYPFKSWRPNRETKDLLYIVDKILTASKYPMTVRQTYYKIISQNILPNSEASYIKLKEIISNGRKAGFIDWDKIEDRSRSPYLAEPSGDPEKYLNTFIDVYAHNLWLNQDKRVEVIVEKQALEGIIKRTCNPWRTPYLASKGFPSITVAMNTAKRADKHYAKFGQTTTILYCGDLDPSGHTMIQTWEKALKLYCTYPDKVSVKAVGLNLDQVRELNLPPQPTKKSDSRAESFMRDISEYSYELDALPDQYLTDLIADNIKAHIDMDEWKIQQQKENEIKDNLRSKLKDD